MSNLYEYAALISDKLHGRIFLNDPQWLDNNVYINRDFTGTLQQLYILRNWEELKKNINEDALWIQLRLHEFRAGKLVFDGNTGQLIADSSAQALYRRYYYNSIWLPNDENSRGAGGIGIFDIRKYLNIFALVFLVILCALIYFILYLLDRQRQVFNLLDILETSTKAQQFI